MCISLFCVCFARWGRLGRTSSHELFSRPFAWNEFEPTLEEEVQEVQYSDLHFAEMQLAVRVAVMNKTGRAGSRTRERGSAGSSVREGDASVCA